MRALFLSASRDNPWEPSIANVFTDALVRQNRETGALIVASCPTRVIVVHDESAFRGALAAALRDAGYEVVAINDPALVVGPPRGADQLEITISRSTGAFPGVRIMVTGFATGQSYVGALAQLLAEPVEVSNVLKALSFFKSG